MSTVLLMDQEGFTFMRYLPLVMIVLALVDAALHFSVDAFVNKTFTNLPYGPLFVALPIGYLILISLLVRAGSATSASRQVVVAAFAIYAAIPLVAYFYLTGGRYNPFQLATIAKTVEVVLILVSLLELAVTRRQQTVANTSVQSAAAK